MDIREAGLEDEAEIIRLFQRSQDATGIPPATNFPRDELGAYLYSRSAIKRLVSIEAGRIVGHSIIEVPNPENIPIWTRGLESNRKEHLIEMGCAFVEPSLRGRGIWSGMLAYRIDAIRVLEATPVSATWSQNEHVKRTFKSYGGTEVGNQPTPAGIVSLFVF